jgi:hypothetical protein
MAIQSQSRAALSELIELLQEIDTHWCQRMSRALIVP